MRTVCGLILNGRVPPRVEVDYHVRAREVESGAAGVEGNKEKRYRFVRVEPAAFAESVLGGAVQVAVGDAARLQLAPQDREHRDELAEDQHAVPAVDGLVEHLEEHVELAGKRRRVFFTQRRRGAEIACPALCLCVSA